MGVREAIEAKKYAECEAEGLRFRVRRVVSRDLVDAGYGLLLAASSTNVAAPNPAKIVEALRRDSEYLAGLCVAGVVGMATADGEWEDWKIVATAEEEDLAAGKMWLGSLPGGVSQVVAATVLKHSGGGEGAVALLSFLRGGAAATRQDRAEVQRAPE